MIKTSAGLPNTCCKCGTPCTSWYAVSDAQAIAGQGVCESCMATPTTAPAAEQTEALPPTLPTDDQNVSTAFPQEQVEEAPPLASADDQNVSTASPQEQVEETPPLASTKRRTRK